MTSESSSGYNIGAVTRMTGIPRERIRIWERRYAAVVPRRDAANNRLYSQDDVDRLVRIRRLVDAGHAIGQVARLDLAELEARQAAAALTPGPALAPTRTLVFGAEAAATAARLEAFGLPEVECAADAADASRRLAAAAPGLLVAALPALLSQDVPPLLQLRRAAGHVPVVLVYRFAPERLLDQLARVGIRTIRAPLQAQDLALRESAEPGGAGSTEFDYRARQFSPDALARLAGLAATVACECPRHLADLVRDLQAFEDYTLACEAATPADAALHREVFEVIARARALTEDALGIIVAEERIAV